MIDAKELRIGNWVFHWPFGTNANALTKVETIRGDRINEDGMLLESLEPIPLTPEILMYCGFTIGDEDRWYFDKDGVHKCVLRHGASLYRGKVIGRQN